MFFGVSAKNKKKEILSGLCVSRGRSERAVGKNTVRGCLMKLTVSRKPARIEMIPLVDIIFLLLVFFIYSMLSMAVYRGIPVMLPAAESVESTRDEAVFVTIDRAGRIFVNQALTSSGALLNRMKQEHAAHPEETAVISADGEAPYGTFVDVLDKVRIAGFQRVSIEARPEGAQSQ